MSERPVTLLWVAVAFLTAILAAWNPCRQNPRSAAELLFPGLRNGKPSEIEIDRDGERVLHVRDADGPNPRLVEPSGPGVQLRELAALIDAARLLRSSRRERSTAPENPSAVVMAHRDGTRRRVELGELAVGGRRQWVHVGDERFLVETHLLEAIFAAAERALVAPRPSATDLRVEIVDGSKKLSITTTQVDWGDGPHAVGPEVARLQRELDDLLDLPLTDAEPVASGEDRRIRWPGVELRELGACRGDGDTEGVLVQVPAGRACVSSERWRALFRPVAEPQFLVRGSLWSVADPPKNLILEIGSVEVTLEASQLDDRALAEWWRRVGGDETAEKILESELSEPPAGRYRIRADGEDVEILSARGRLWARRRGEKILLHYPGLDETLFAGVALQLRPRTLLDEEPAMIRSLSIEDSAVVRTFRADSWPDRWLVEPAVKIDSDLLRRLVLELSHLRAVGFRERRPGPVLRSRSFELRYADPFGGADTIRRLELTQTRAGCFVVVATGASGPVAELSVATCALLLSST